VGVLVDRGEDERTEWDMPHKGLFTQCVCILLEEPARRSQIDQLLEPFPVRAPSSTLPGLDMAIGWCLGKNWWLIDFNPAVHGVVLIDRIDQPWPDRMNSSPDDPLLFGAWSFGHFGVFTSADGLERAKQHCWSWAAGRQVAERHRSVLRVRSSYTLGGSPSGLPKDYRSLPELLLVTQLASTLAAGLPEALCYFNPNGEVLRSSELLGESLAAARSRSLPPLDAWSNIRMTRLGGADAGWILMDTVGNGQFDVPDVQAGFLEGKYEPGEVDGFLRNVTLDFLRRGVVIKDRDTLDGPGQMRWRGHWPQESGNLPPRRVLRCLPVDGTVLSSGLAAQKYSA
jgi:hypothetical protein